MTDAPFVPVDYVGGHAVYWQCPRYVPYELPWARYCVYHPLIGERQMNVSRIFLACWPEEVAVPMTAWGDFQNDHPAALAKVIAEFGYHRVRRDFVKKVEFEFVF